MKRFLSIPCLVFFVIFLSSSCRKSSPWWDTDLSGPIAKSSITIGNLLPDSVLASNADSSVHVVYNANIFNFAVDSLVQIPDTTLPENNYTIPAGTVSYSAGQSLFSTPVSETFFDIDNVNLTYAIVKSGMVKMEATNSVADPLVFQYSLLQSDLGGSPFSISEEVPGGTVSNPGTITKYYSLAGLAMSLTGINGDKYNTIVTQQVVSVSSSATGGSIVAPQGVKVKISFLDIVPEYAKGYMGNESISIGPENLSFDFLKNMHADYFQLEDANVNLKLINGLGVDMSVSNVQLTSYNSAKNTSVVLSGSGVSSTYNVNRAQNSSNPSFPINQNIQNHPLNSGNSNVKAFIENLPDQITYQLNGQVNPMGNVSGNNDFVKYGYGFRADLEMDLPFAFATTNLTFTDTAALSLGDLTEAENINHGTLTLRATNGFPFDAAVQAYICDASFNIVDSLFSVPNIISAANVDGAFKVTAPMLSVLTIPVDHEKIHKLQDNTFVIYKIRMNTVSQLPAPQVIKIYDYYRMDLVLTADINYSINGQ